MRIASLIGLAALAACDPTMGETPERSDPACGGPPRNAEYIGVQTRLLDDDLVNFLVEMRGASVPADVSAYARCAAAQYTLIRGYGFARHIRTNVDEEGGLWRGDAVYTLSPGLPRGARNIDAEVVVETCAQDGIPTV